MESTDMGNGKVNNNLLYSYNKEMNGEKEGTILPKFSNIKLVADEQIKYNNGKCKTMILDTETSKTSEISKFNSFINFTSNKAMRIKFYRNGDNFFPGAVITVSLEHYRSIDALYVRLNKILADSTTLPHGVRYIYSIDGLELITSILQLKNGCGYVCSSSETFKPLNYLKVQPPSWSLNAVKSPNLPSKLLKSFIKEPNDFVYPKIITIIRNGLKPRKVVRMLLNKRTALSFEHVMQEITALIKLDSGIVKKLLTLNKKEVVKLVDFFEDDNVFIAYGLIKINDDDFRLSEDESKKLFYTTKKGLGREMRMPFRNESIVKREKYLPINSIVTKLPNPLADYLSIYKILGDGNTAVVYEAYDKRKNERRAVKIISNDNTYKEFISTELNLMKNINHEYIVKMFEYWYFDNSVYILLELMPDGDLFEYLKASPFPERDAASFIKCLVSALDYLHERNIVHRDVKPENLLVFTTNNLFCLKLADFGLATIIKNENKLFELCGTPTYVAPEILAEIGYGPKVDIWSAGIILYVLLCGFPPFMSMEGDRDTLFSMIMNGHFEFPHPIWDDKSYCVKILIQRMLNIDVEERYSAVNILQNPWIKKLSKVEEEYEKHAEICYYTNIRKNIDTDWNSHPY